MKDIARGLRPAQSNETSIIVIAETDEVAQDLQKVVEDLPNFSCDNQKGTLSSMNGAAVALADQGDLVIFETTPDNDGDLATVASIRAQLDRSARLMALTGKDISLSDARRLTRAGVDEILTYPFDITEARDQIERWARPNEVIVVPQEDGVRRQPGKIITVAKSRGGIGGTTVAVNLADALQAKTGMLRKTAKHRVALVDLDFQLGDAASFLDVDPHDGLFQLAHDGGKPDLIFLRQTLQETTSGVDLISAPSRFAPLNGLTAEQVETMLSILKAEYDYVVVDLPPALVEWMTPVMELSDRLLMVTDTSVPSIRQARRLIDFYTDDNVALKIDLVVNREKKPLLKSAPHTEAANVLERPLRFWLPSDQKAARDAIDRGAPLSVVSGRSALTKSIAAMAEELAKDIQTTAQAAAQPAIKS